MSMFLCPLCGKQCSIKYYHPESFDDDVEVFHNVGLGRGKGLEKITGFSLDDFPELKEKLGNRARRVSEFLNPKLGHVKVPKAFERLLDEEMEKRIRAEEQLEELDIDLLLHKIGKFLGMMYSDIHTAVDDLLTRNIELGKSRNDLRSLNKSQAEKIRAFEREKRNLVSENNRLKKEINDLRENRQKWVNAYRILENNYSSSQRQINEISNRLSGEQNKRIQLEENLVELDLQYFVKRLQDETESYSINLHDGINNIISEKRALFREIDGALNFINNVLPDEYDLYDDLGDALGSMYQYYEDLVEELSDE